jgi:hypothetical protein
VFFLYIFKAVCEEEKPMMMATVFVKWAPSLNRLASKHIFLSFDRDRGRYFDNWIFLSLLFRS